MAHARRSGSRIPRPVTTLLVVAVAILATVTVLPWLDRGGDPEAAALSSPRSESTGDVVPSTAPEPTGVGAAADPTVPPGSTAGPPAPSATAPPVTGPATAGPTTAGHAAALQARLDELRARLGIPGVSATILFPDGSSWTGTSGLANVRAKAGVEPDTAFAIASISKTFTAALILALVEDGEIELDARVSRYLPDLALVGKATVRQLLDHTSGLSDYFSHPRIDRHLLGDRGRAWTATETLAYVRKPVFKPGRSWYYSNTNYFVLGMLAEAVDGRPLATQLRERFLDPLDLEHTYEQVDEDPRGPTAHGYRVGGTSSRPRYADLSDRSDNVPFTSLVTAAHGAGSIAATSGDVARWARALYGGEVLADASLAAMIDDARRIAKLRPRIPYGLGVQVLPLDGRRAYGHSGRLAGFRSVVRHLPAERITIAVLTNEATQDPAVIARALLRIALKPAPAR